MADFWLRGAFYALGRRSGFKKSQRRFKRTATAMRQEWEAAERNPECINFQPFCEAYGSCDGQQCEYKEG